MKPIDHHFNTGDKVFFIYNGLPHTGIVQYYQTDDIVLLKNVTFILEEDIDEMSVPAKLLDYREVAKTITLPKYPDKGEQNLVGSLVDICRMRNFDSNDYDKFYQVYSGYYKTI